MRFVYFTVLLGLYHSVAAQQETYIVSQSSNLCLTIGSDEHTLQYLACSSDQERVKHQRWKVIQKVNGDVIQNAAGLGCIDSKHSNNGGVAQVWGCDSTNAAQTISFGSDGRIKSTADINLCLGQYSTASVGDMMQFKDCDAGQATNWATSATIPGTAASSSSSSSTTDGQPHAPPVAPVISSTGSTGSPPQLGGAPTLGSFLKNPSFNTDSTSSSTPTEKDHYLCVCVVEAGDEKCVQAVKAACAVGHIPSDDCLASFDRGDHEAISTHVINLIENGARCSKFDPKTLINENPTLPTRNFKGRGVVTSEDHYLCVCLNEGGTNLDETCEAAVKTACIVGHIPQSDCDITFAEGKTKVVDHVLRLIDNGANCKNKLVLTKSANCPEPPCYGDTNGKNLVTQKDHYLCPCIDDYKSQACLEATRQACRLGHMPQQDCLVAEKGNYLTGVTRNVLQLVEHGAQCSAHKSMRFTNNRCHCKQTWKTDRGEILKFPENCADPGNVRGFPWCETYDEEGCTGVGGSFKWDRCDNPQHPVRDIRQRSQGKSGKITTSDHYLCICIDSNANNEVCLAAAKAACAVGHIPADACRESFENNDHEKVTERVLELIKNGAQCKNVERNYGKMGSFQSSVVPIDNSLPAKAKHASAICGHGSVNGNGGCTCFAGYAGSECNECAVGFIDYPDCKERRLCSPKCKNGVCNEITGNCVCPQNFMGELCENCVAGLSGPKCLPGGVSTGNFSEFIRFVKHVVLFCLFVGGIIGLVYLYKTKCTKQHDNLGYYAQVPGGSTGGLGEYAQNLFSNSGKRDQNTTPAENVNAGDNPFRTGLAI
mmetsp:Transcript_10070/g.13072  ORF Transcript_10070/g.13072 Transcript_10070/m.13072 type:complete len:826 (-) Transcript_10070:1798-4275(-)|eukprot:CAMPEP_0204834092 /NCGR_PEP_ID=MMETSP1346-20131115/18736_1 /ASSEMBLY_ACC=CAM_ASM_000771 /TAXON_ID=215587 /ORGANISM="Aplanochytrium stocchinoi, Strain GSBS06" /LENGTH=825 /DNA_ID=CAMNT_0051967125 /DNA_START=99 /DNA_END=2576 /DNA_ORIENTATION=+